MFEKVLIAEDQQSVNFSIQQTVKELGITQVSYAYYCDDALLALKESIKEQRPFELLIADLSFLEDKREQMLADGAALIGAAKALQRDLKVVVFSGESNPAVAKDLIDKYGIDGYVLKGREDVVELKKAIAQVLQHKRYLPAGFQQVLRHTNTYEFSGYDIAIISQMIAGTPQKGIPSFLQAKGMKATSLSSIEKRLGQIRGDLGFTKNEQLIAYCKDNKIL
jgi:two-component system capsular synthesis response regulator RcsB